MRIASSPEILRNDDVRLFTQAKNAGNDMYRKLLLAYDSSRFSAAALRRAAELAGLFNAELHLLGIVVTTGGMAIAEAVGPPDVWGRAQEDLKRAVEPVVKDLRARGLTVFAGLRYGAPAVEIAARAKEIGADLVVVGHNPQDVLTRWFQGSVGSRLLDHLPCSLLVVTDQSE
mgnify:CR=1 FL=1